MTSAKGFPVAFIYYCIMNIIDNNDNNFMFFFKQINLLI